MKKSNLWITINSFFIFVSAFIFVKSLVILSKFIVMRSFGGSTQIKNFEIECITWKYSAFWTPTSVISIYLTGAITAAIMAIIAYVLYRALRTRKGFVKLFFSWVYVIAINQSIGIFLRDIPAKRDIYHALNWMYIPYWAMIVIMLISIPVLFFANVGNDIKFLRMATSNENIISNKERGKLYTRVALLPAILGSVFMLLTHFKSIQFFEIIEALLIIVSIGFTYAIFFKENFPVQFRINKSEPTDKFSVFSIALFCTAIALFYYLITTYY